jgi:DNA repair protein RadD
VIVPRYYQNDCVEALWSYFMTKYGNPLCALPTGTGKSVIIAMFLRAVFGQYPQTKVMVLTHVKELIKQNYEKLIQFWPGAPAGINSAGLNRRDVHDKIIFGGIGSVAKFWASFGHVDLLLIDEAHLVSPTDTTQYQKFIAGLKSINPHLKVVGFTATKWRVGSGLLTESGMFTDMAYDITGRDEFNKLISEGFIVPPVPKKTKAMLNVDGVHMQGGEFIQNELQEAVDIHEITEAALKEAIVLGEDRHHWLVFASGISHAEHISEILNDLGVPCAAVHSKMDNRNDTIAAFRSGKLRAVANTNVLTTGFDFPAIDFMPMLRPTASSVLWVQMVGRGTRPVYESGFDLTTTEGRLAAIQASQKQNCLVPDYARNTKRLGPINDPVIPNRKGKKRGDAPVKLCEKCDCYNHASARECAYCGEPFPLHIKLTSEAGSEELLAGEMPVTEDFKVDRITVAVHEKVGRPPSVRVSYYAGDLTRFDEFLLVEDNRFIAQVQRWWSARSPEPCPNKTLDFILRFETLKLPTDIRVWTNKKPYPRIMAFCFDGTGFGKRVASDSDEGPVVRTEVRPGLRTPVTAEVKAGHIQSTNVSDPYDDDIPF